MGVLGEWEKKLKNLHQTVTRFREQVETGAPLPLADLTRLKQELESLTLSPHVVVSKLAQLERLVRPELALRELDHLLVPIERALEWDRDDELPLLKTDGLLPATQDKPTIPLIFYLDHLRSAYNVGSLFRLGEALGIEALWLGGYTATPDNPKVAKAAMGCESKVPWTSLPEGPLSLAQPYRLIALEVHPKAISILEPFDKVPTVLIAGNERFGIGPQLLSQCYEIRTIPMAGWKNSLNVTQALSIAAFEWKRQYEL